MMTAWTTDAPPALDDSRFARWRELLEGRTGIDLSQHRAILQGGLNRCLRELGEPVDPCGSAYDRLFECVSDWPAGRKEWDALLDALAVHETRFFRQPAAFGLVADFLAERLARVPDRTLDLWSAGCSAGEEAYSLAMVAAEALAAARSPRYLGIVGSDISAGMLARGRSARYGVRQVEYVPPLLRERYLLDDGAGHVKVAPALTARLCWVRTNLLERDGAAWVPAMDVIFCQNVLVYFRRWRVRQVLDLLVRHLKPGGLLVLGPGEVTNWHHPALKSCARQGVNAWLRIGDTEQEALPG